jgi:hypothetical protein
MSAPAWQSSISFVVSSLTSTLFSAIVANDANRYCISLSMWITFRLNSLAISLAIDFFPENSRPNKHTPNYMLCGDAFD